MMKNQKLAELRSRTDRQLLAYLSARLDRALAAGPFTEAEQIQEELRHLLPLVQQSNPTEWQRLAQRLNQLSEALDGSAMSHSAG